MMKRSRGKRGGAGVWALLSLLALFVMVAAPLEAQTAASSGTVAGTVTDKTGEVIPGTQVTLTNTQTGAVRSAPSNAQGIFHFALVSPGTYTLTAARTGFATMRSQAAQVIVGLTTTINFTMQPGAQTQTVEVTGAAPLVNTAQTGVAGNISTAQVQNLPLNGNDYGSLAVLVPGVKPVRPYDPTKTRVATFSVDGGTGRNVNVTVNGVEDKDNSVGGPVMQLPLNAIAEFKVSPSRFSAANGRTEGAAINVVEKEGTNTFHGGGQYYFTNTSLNANDYFSKQSKQSTPLFDRQQFGADIGGPVVKDRDFFFFAFTRDNEKTSIPVTATAQAELALVKSLGAEPVAVIPTPYHDSRYSVRLDHTMNAANHLSFNFNWQSNFGENDQDSSTDDATENNFSKNNLILGGLTWNTVISPTTVNSLTAGYQYWNNLIDTHSTAPLTVSFPAASFGINGNVPQNTTQKKWELRDDFSTDHGKHSLKFGEDFIWEPFLGGFFKFNEVPSLSFSDNPSDILANKDGLYPDGFATPGAVTGMSLTAGDSYYKATGGVKSLGLYAEDDWQATPRLTVNLGMRYSLDLNTFGQNDQAKARTNIMLKKIGSPFAGIPQTDKRDLSPVVGFTYDLTGHGKQIIRGGFGMYYGETFNNQTLFMLQQTNPTLFSTVYSVTLSGVAGACSQCDVPGTNIPLSQYRYTVDPNPVWTAGAPTELPAGGRGQTMDPAFRNPVSEQWNVGYSLGINQSNAIIVDYVHELGLHEARTQTINPVVNVTTGARQFDSTFQAAGLPPLGRISVYGSFGRSRYDSLSIEWKRQMSHNISLDASYNLARSLAWGGSAASFGGSQITLDPWDPINFGYSGTDQRHRVVFSGIFNLPYGINVAPIMQLGSPQPYSTSLGTSLFGYGSGFSSPHAIVPNSDPTDYTAFVGDHKTDPEWQKEVVNNYNTLPCLQDKSCHQLPINSLRGQPFFDLDARFGKRFSFKDKYAVNLFFQGFDLTNRANFGARYQGNIRSSSFMKPTGYISGSGVTIPKSFRGEFGVDFTF